MRSQSFASKSAKTFASKTINNSSQNNDFNGQSMVGESSHMKTPNANSVNEMTKRNVNRDHATLDRRIMNFATNVFNASSPLAFVVD